MPVYEIDDIPRLALGLMNNVHHEEVLMVNRLGELIEAGLAGENNAEAISAKADAWLQHTREHFERENTLMREHGFPAYSVHSDEHRRVLAQLEAVCDEWKEQRDLERLSHYVRELWPRWFQQHVETMDAMTAQFLSMYVPREGGEG